MAKSFPDLNKDGKTSFADVLVGRGVDTSKTATAKKGGAVKNNFIQEAIKKPGALRASMGVKKGEKILAKKLAVAAKKPGKMGQRARLAQTLSKFKK
jgi:hypothetical protein